MEMDQLRHETGAVLHALRETRNRVAGDIDEGLKSGDRLRDAARGVGESSSDSWVGWHSRMYYGEYEQPPVQESWNTDWGGIHGFSDHWRERSQSDVQQEIERSAATTLAHLASTADRVREACQPMQQEVLTVLSPVCDLAGLKSEAELLAKLESITWIVPPGDYVQVMAPAQVVSRDSHALYQGIQPPLHLNVDAAIVSNTSTLATSRDFLNDAIRLVRQVQTKLAAIPASERVEAPAAGAAVDVRLESRLRRRSVALVALLALAIFVGVVLALQELVDSRLIAAVIIVAAVLSIAGIYALLVNRRHVGRALVIAASVGSAIAAVDQLLGPYPR